MADEMGPRRQFHASKFEIGVNGYIITDCTNDETCAGRMHFVSWSIEDIRMLSDMLDERQGIRVFNKE